MQDKEIEKVADRCKRICGGSTEQCYIRNDKQLRCIADMVINKTATIIKGLKSALENDDNKALKQAALLSMRNATELSNWIQYLQTISDYNSYSKLVLDATSSERRTEIRYPLWDRCQKKFQVLLNNGADQAEILNISQSGVELRTQKDIPKGTIMECQLVANKQKSRATHFIAEAVYCKKVGDAYECGARVLEAGGEKLFNFFGFVHQFTINIEMNSLLD